MNIGLFTDAYTPQVNGVITFLRILEEELINYIVINGRMDVESFNNNTGL